MVPQLPDEIWTQIVSYLPSRDVVKLCGLNHLFHAFAQSVRYKHIRVAQPTRRTVAVLQHMKRAPQAAQYTEILELHIGAFMLLEFSRPRWKNQFGSTLKPLRELLGPAKDYSARTQKSACEVFELLLDAAKHMDKIRHLRMVFYLFEDTDQFQPYVNKLRELLSERVTSLSIDQLLTKDVASFSAAFKDLSRLKHLSLQLYSPDMESWAGSSCLQVAQLINSVRRTLQSLALDTSFRNAIEPLPSILSNLDRFECLTRIGLCMDLDDSAAQSIAKSLNFQGKHLEELSIKVRCTHPAVSFLSNLDLPRLRKLDLDLGIMSEPQAVAFWAGTLRLELAELSISVDTFPNQIRVFCDAFRRSGVGHSLRNLSLELWMCDDAALDAMATTFTDLRTLSIRCKEAFCLPRDDILTLSCDYLDWPIYDLTIAQMVGEPGTYLPRYPVMKAVAASVPSIRSFCGNGHMDEPSGALTDVGLPSLSVTERISRSFGAPRLPHEV